MANDIANNMADTINQLERQLQTELDNNHCLEIEIGEVKKLLKEAITIVHDYACGYCPCCKNYDKDTNRCLVDVYDCQHNDRWEWLYETEAQKWLNN